MNKNTRPIGAHLTLGVEIRLHRTLNGLVDIEIIKNDQWRLSAEFKSNGPDKFARCGQYCLTSWHRAREWAKHDIDQPKIANSLTFSLFLAIRWSFGQRARRPGPLDKAHLANRPPLIVRPSWPRLRAWIRMAWQLPHYRMPELGQPVQTSAMCSFSFLVLWKKWKAWHAHQLWSLKPVTLNAAIWIG